MNKQLVRTLLVYILTVVLILVGTILIGYPYPVLPTVLMSVDTLLTIIGLALVLSAGAVTSLYHPRDRPPVDKD